MKVNAAQLPTATSQVKDRCRASDQLATGKMRKQKSNTPKIRTNETTMPMIWVIKSGVVSIPLTTAITAAAISARFISGQPLFVLAA
jgi:hypothetical protein